MGAVSWESMGMGGGVDIAGFRRILQGLQNTKCHRSAFSLVSRAFFVEPDKQRSFDTVPEIGDHVKAGIDPIIKVTEKMELR